MSDIYTNWDIAGLQGDWVLSGASLETDNGLQTALLISIFTDQRASSDDVIPDGTDDPRGWWADDPEHPIGSKLWLLSRAKQSNETLLNAQNYLTQALQWMIDDGVVIKFDIQVGWNAPSFLAGRVIAYRQAGQTVAVNFQYSWNK